MCMDMMTNWVIVLTSVMIGMSTSNWKAKIRIIFRFYRVMELSISGTKRNEIYRICSCWRAYFSHAKKIVDVDDGIFCYIYPSKIV